MRFVELKNGRQLDAQTLHRSRGRLVSERIALINQSRAISFGRGIIVAQRRRKFERELVVMVDDKWGSGLAARLVNLVEDMRAQWKEFDRRIGEFDAEFATFVKTDEDATLLLSIHGVGVLIASALAAAIGRGGSLAKARELPAWLGLVPRHASQ